MSIAAARRCADRNENGFRCGDCRGQLRRKGEAPLARVTDDESMETGLKDWDIATVQGRDPFSVLINADHAVAKIGKTSTRDKSDIAAANHCDTHQVTLSLQTRTVAAFARSTWHKPGRLLGSSNRPWRKI